MVIGTVSLIDFIRGGVHGINCVQTNTALEAGTGCLPKQSQHFSLFHQIVIILKNMGIAVDFFSSQMTGSGHNIFVFWLVCQLVGLGNRIDMRGYGGMIHHAGNFFGTDASIGLESSQALDIFLGSF